jgi:hypothetical protein
LRKIAYLDEVSENIWRRGRTPQELRRVGGRRIPRLDLRKEMGSGVGWREASVTRVATHLFKFGLKALTIAFPQSLRTFGRQATGGLEIIGQSGRYCVQIRQAGKEAHEPRKANIRVEFLEKVVAVSSDECTCLLIF